MLIILASLINNNNTSLNTFASRMPFSSHFLEKCNEFMGACFASYRGAGKDALINTECQYYLDAFVGDEDDDRAWQLEQNECFKKPNETVDCHKVCTVYQELVGATARELGIGVESISQ